MIIIKYIIEKIKKNKVLVCSITFIFCIMVFLTSRYSVAIDNEDYVSISCPANVNPGQIISCKINASITTINALSVDCHYDVTDGINFNKFTTGEDWNEFASSKNGFAVGNINGVTGASHVGTVEYIIPKEAKSGDTYIIGLKDVKFSDDNYEMLNLGDASVNIKVLEESSSGGKEDDDVIIDSKTELDNANGNKTNEIISKNAKTGDKFILFSILMMVCFIYFIIYYKIRNKKSKN